VIESPRQLFQPAAEAPLQFPDEEDSTFLLHLVLLLCRLFLRRLDVLRGGPP
jgi:hypothetical protein